MTRRRDLEEEEEARIGDVLFPPRKIEKKRGSHGEQGDHEELEGGEQEVMEEQEGTEEQQSNIREDIEGQEVHDHIRALNTLALC